MRILMYTPTVPMEAGGVQAVFHQLSDGLATRGHELRRVWPVRFADSPTPAMEDYVPGLDGIDATGRRHALRESAWKYRRLGAVLRGLRPQVVNVHFVRPGCRHFLRWRRLFNYRVVLTFHGSDALRTDPRDLPTLKNLIRRADAVTAVSPPVVERVRELVDAPALPVHLIPNGIDWAYWSAPPPPPPSPSPRPPLSPTAGSDCQPPVVLAVGRLFEVKNHQLLVRAMAEVHRHRPDARLVILGGGHCEAALRRQIAELGLADVAELAGQADPPRVHAWLSRAAVYVMPSLSEGMPLSLLEAMAAGVPCIATAVGGVPHLAGTDSPEAHPDPAVQLVPSEDHQDLARQITRVLQDPPHARALADRGRRRAQQFTLNQTVTRYEQLFQNLAR